MEGPVSSCMYSEWIGEESRITVEDNETKEKGTLNNEKYKKDKGYKHVSHKDKPAQVVARRNARERRRVQAVNTAFARLRKVVPVENARGKRISKVKTLQHAIDYIQAMVEVLEQDRNYDVFAHYYAHRLNEDFFINFNYNDEL